MMRAGSILIFSLFFCVNQVVAQQEEDDEPVYVIDSVLSSQGAMSKISPDQIGMMTIAKGSKAVEKYGPQAANGVIYIETKPFARKRVSTLLRSASKEYDSVYRKYGSDSTFFFLVNTQPVNRNNEGILLALDARNFVSLKVIYARELEDKYKVDGHPVGVVITSSGD
ncbi:hypothetical protein SAMN05660909_01079 [Chitinophaga terrae (ex Kim and Jung 2007)]|uniref:TonB-dependent receptor plug domain-containing protein n=1 Tax=Chitinophaga terrae (ex Kim and Jung 2007) TaxID=408074 RepID=A0A1H3Z756_9BACT|nr:hypothetical protein [Chitinophaga terrae (ex Kim and Jung 2007)]GEP88613.1 hypothetical protein CTE07_02580 [Chitinophaga terrae (ex Kim and Jung 2007)]SEA19619.1 hypothetical protein SAMN05660909_01079 [Chitinophaga terrae (ex Kim and Jung 2007)]